MGILYSILKIPKTFQSRTLKMDAIKIAFKIACKVALKFALKVVLKLEVAFEDAYRHGATID